MKFYVFFLFAVFVTGCGAPQPDDTVYPSKKGALANKVRREAFTQLKIEKDLQPCGFGGQMMDQIQMLALSFDYYKEIDIAEARGLLIHAGKTFLNIINSNEEIRPFLHNYPFKSENIEIRIFLKKPNGSECDLDNLCVVNMVKGILSYKIDEPEKYRLLIIHKETYDEALSKLASPEVYTQL